MTEFVWTEDPQALPGERKRKFPNYGYLFRALTSMVKEVVTLVPKSRQLLLTWLICAYAVIVAAFAPSGQVLVQSETETKAKKLILRMGYMIRHFPKWLLPCRVDVKKSEICFEWPNGDRSYIWSVAHGPDQVASYSPTLVIFDEATLQKHFEAAWLSTAPILRGNAKAIAVGTPRWHEYFYSLCTKIMPERAVTVHYKEHPGYQAEAEEMGGWDAWAKAKQKLWGYMRKDGTVDQAKWDREMEVNWDVTGEGTVAFPEFKRSIHVQRLGPNLAWPVIRGWDFGFHHPACVWFQIHPLTGQQLILRELMGEGIQLHQFVQRVLRVSRELMPGCTPYSVPRGPFEDFCDLAGSQQKDVGPTSIEVLNENRIYPSYKRSKPIDRVKLIRRQLASIPDGLVRRPGMLVDPSCDTIIRGLAGGCTFKHDDHETVDFGIFQHVFDALGYAMTFKFHLGAVEAKGRRHVTA